jgi:hypothetical protein
MTKKKMVKKKGILNYISLLNNYLNEHTPTNWHYFLSIIKEYLLFGIGNTRLYYSEDGIDAVLKSKMKGRKIFYVDVGANHPFRNSNTYFFYKKGSRGINIDATPEIMRSFKIVRRKDINLEIPISTVRKPMYFWIFKHSQYNGFFDIKKKFKHPDKVKKIIKMIPSRLSEVLDEHLPRQQKIDFLSVDVEGLDLDVLKSNNWNKYRPKYIIIEMWSSCIKDIINNDISSYLNKIGYKLVSYARQNALFERRSK